MQREIYIVSFNVVKKKGDLGSSSHSSVNLSALAITSNDQFVPPSIVVKTLLIYASVSMGMYMFVWVCAGPCLHTCVWRPEVDIAYLSRSLIESAFHPNLKLTNSASQLANSSRDACVSTSLAQGLHA